MQRITLTIAFALPDDASPLQHCEVVRLCAQDALGIRFPDVAVQAEHLSVERGTTPQDMFAAIRDAIAKREPWQKDSE